MEHFPRATDLDCALEDWLVVFAAAFDALLPGGEAAAFHRDVAERVRSALFDADAGPVVG